MRRHKHSVSLEHRIPVALWDGRMSIAERDGREALVCAAEREGIKLVGMPEAFVLPTPNGVVVRVWCRHA